MMEVFYIRANKLVVLEEAVNEAIKRGWEPFLPLVVRGESLIQPMRRWEDNYFVTVGEQATAMYEIGAENVED